MGLSGRRRAKKDTRTTKPTVPDHRDLIRADSRQPHHQTRSQRSGNTHRRVCGAIARDRKHTNLLAVEVARGWGDHLMPARPATHPDIGAPPNANLCNRKMARILDNDFTNDVNYSLNKKSRWRFAKQIRQEYDSCEELKRQNVFLIESEARGPTGGAVKRLTTNASYTLDAAEELRTHKRKLSHECSYLPKQRVMERDRFQFSDEVTQRQAERPLTEAASHGGAINKQSFRRACNLWNHLYNVSPSAEEVRMAMQRDYEGRAEVLVGTCVPCQDVDTNRCRQVEKLARFERMNRRDISYRASKQFDSRARKERRCEMEMQLEVDGSQVEVAEPAEIEAAADAVECPVSFSLEVTLFDAMRPKLSGSINRAKKLAMKEQKMKKLERLQLQKKKRRYDSDETAGASSGYDSGRDDGEYEMMDVEAGAEIAKDAVDARLSEAVEAALMTERPVVSVHREAADEARLVDLLGQQLAVGNSLPRKLAVMLALDLSETVVFEEVAGGDAAVATFAIQHSCGAGAHSARTSAQEVASQPDPFAFLASLLVEASEESQMKQQQQQEAEHRAGDITAGWRRAKVLSESDARLAAIRQLPMFSASPEMADDDVELVPRLECEICCQQLQDGGCGSAAFAEGSTMLIGCGHRFCNRCWLYHVASSVARGRADVACPGFRCQSALDAATLLWFCPSGLLPALTAAAFRAWLSERRRQRRHCPQPMCGRVLECRGGVNAVCGVCSGGGLCLGCGQEPHWPCDCATAAQYRKRMEALGHVKLFLHDLQAETDVNAKQCPNCHLLMEKGVGCNHMTCPCGENFCWWCGQSMRVHNRGPCYSASTGRSKSTFHVQRVFTARDSVLVPNSSQSRLYCEAVKMRLLRQSTPFRLTASRLQLADLFASYAIRFQEDGRGSWQDAKRYARRTSNQMIDTNIQASYLVEYSYAHMDRHPGDRRASTAVRALGSHIGLLVENMTSEMKRQCKMGFQGPKHTREAGDRLLMMLTCLRGKCRLLHCIVAAHRDRTLAGSAAAM